MGLDAPLKAGSLAFWILPLDFLALFMSSSVGPRKAGVGKAFPEQLIKAEIGTAGWEPGKLTYNRTEVLTGHA